MSGGRSGGGCLKKGKGKWVGMLILGLLFIAGCSDKNSVPHGILPRDKMEDVLWDMAQADQYAALYVAKDSAHVDRKTEIMRLYEEVFRLHSVTREDFRKSYQYYLDHPEQNQLLFDSVIAHGVRQRSEMYDRPSPYKPAAPVVKSGPGGVTPAGPVRPGTPGVGNPGRSGAGNPGVAMPGVFMPGPAGEAARRARAAMVRRQDSLARARGGRRDTARHVNRDP